MTAGRDLLAEAIEAHGGLARWQAAGELVIRARSGGFALASRGKPRAFKAYEARISMTVCRSVISPYPGAGQRGVFQGDSVRIESETGASVAERADPRRAFRDFRHNFWWDALDALYFAGYALWNYLSTPFLFLRPGFEVSEIGPWEERGERWRRLRVVFPPDVPTHCREQVFYFDAGGLLRRLDYTAEVFGSWAKAAHYCWDHREFSGLVVPTRRRVFPRARSGRARRAPTLVWIQVDGVSVRAR